MPDKQEEEKTYIKLISKFSYKINTMIMNLPACFWTFLLSCSVKRITHLHLRGNVWIVKKCPDSFPKTLNAPDKSSKTKARLWSALPVEQSTKTVQYCIVRNSLMSTCTTSTSAGRPRRRRRRPGGRSGWLTWRRGCREESGAG